MSSKTRKAGRRATSGGVAHGSPSSAKATSASKRPPARPRRESRGLTGGTKTAIAIGLAVVALGAIYLVNRPRGSGGGHYAFQVGQPGPGSPAPQIKLPSTDGGTFDLAATHGKTVLLYFQEGLTCQPCWDQLKDIDAQMAQFKSLGIDEIVSVTTDPLDALKQKVTDEGISTPVLSDSNLAVSQSYHANSYGMMGDSRDGHSFIVVGPDGNIEWRADYGGSPNYTMYLPVSSLIADIRKGLAAPG